LWARRRDALGPVISGLWYLERQIRKTVGLHLVVLLAALILARKWGSRMQAKRWLGFWALFYLFCVWFTNFRTGHQISDRYLHPVVCCSLLFLGPFFEWVAERPMQMRLVAAYLVLFAAWMPVMGRRTDQLAMREAGEWILKRHGGAGAVISSCDDKVPYYARGVAREMTRTGSAYFVVCDKDTGKVEPEPALRLVATFPAKPKRGDRVVRVFAR